MPTVTSSFNWEEVGRRSCSVGDRTLVPSGVGCRAVQYQEANRALDTLYLTHNNVGDAGAAALAEALKATVLTCSQ